MNRKLRAISIFFILVVIFSSCTSQKYIHDVKSRERQTELKKHRSGNVFGDIGLMIASVFISSTLNIDAGFYSENHEFKKLRLINPTKDTIYINMLTDVYWDEENFCDFMDIRIPPHGKCKMLVPLNANYNVYFSNTPEQDDDEMLEINTDDFKKLSLYPGLRENEEINSNQ